MPTKTGWTPRNVESHRFLWGLAPKGASGSDFELAGVSAKLVERFGESGLGRFTDLKRLGAVVPTKKREGKAKVFKVRWIDGDQPTTGSAQGAQKKPARRSQPATGIPVEHSATEKPLSDEEAATGLRLLKKLIYHKREMERIVVVLREAGLNINFVLEVPIE